jgi:alkylation response protein AidB-like acyl-CoA dehydrogenase
MGQIARAKANATRLGRETVALARECMGGNGIILEYHVMKAMGDMEVMYTYEGTYDINSLVSGRELTGGLAAIR